ncbi:MAG: hypothetical protein ACYC8T_36045 [Myxococcaceae bacterium]
MKRASLLALSVAALSCGGAGGVHQYRTNDLMFAPSYTAKESCSCLFVMGQTEEYCRAWTKASPQVANFTVDYKTKTVEAHAIMMWGARAHYVSDRAGCVLE